MVVFAVLLLVMGTSPSGKILGVVGLTLLVTVGCFEGSVDISFFILILMDYGLVGKWIIRLGQSKKNKK